MNYILILTETKFKSFNEIFVQNFEHYLELTEEFIEFFNISFLNEFYKRNFTELNKIGEVGYGTVFKAGEKLGQKDFCVIKKIFLKKEFESETLREIYRFFSLENLFLILELHFIKMHCLKIV